MFDALCQNPKKQAEKQEDRSQRAPLPTFTKPPAIFIYGITNRYQFSKTLTATCQIRPVVKQTAEFIIFQAQSKADFDKLQIYCLQQQIQFALETHKQDRPLKVVLRKLSIDIIPADIYKGLVTQGLPVSQVTQLHGRDKTTKGKI